MEKIGSMMYVIYLFAFNTVIVIFIELLQNSLLAIQDPHGIFSATSLYFSFIPNSSKGVQLVFSEIVGLDGKTVVISSKALAICSLTKKLFQKSEDLFEILCLEYTKKFRDYSTINLL